MFDQIRTHIARPGVVRRHTLDNGAHGVAIRRFETIGGGLIQGSGFEAPLGYGAAFFSWHKTYLGDLEARLPSGVQLATWAPWETIPNAFLTNGIHQPGMGQQTFALFSDDVIGHFADEDALGVQLSWGPHFETHVRTGGDMMVVDTASRVPIFWPWHAFVDDLHKTWDERRKRYGDNQPMPKYWPWGTSQATSLPGGSASNRTNTPFLIGKRLIDARAVIVSAGLTVGSTDTTNGNARIVSQSPLPFTNQARNSPVNLGTRLPEPDNVAATAGDTVQNVINSLYPPRLP